ncbi:hypothetical protein TNCT_707351 [Trichonephila clavata]|nr:hypothetical protein TNCT_707351 [Trichonephila clavata]
MVLYWDFHHVPDDLIGRITAFEVFFHKQKKNEDVPWKKCVNVFARTGAAQVSLKGFTEPGRYSFYVAALDSLNGQSTKSDTVHVTIRG